MKNQILEHLRENHRGRENAVPSRELEKLFNIKGPTLRRHISELRFDGEPICSGQTGYYYASTAAELRRTVNYFGSHLRGTAKARSALDTTLAEMTDTGQTTLYRANEVK